MGRKRIDEDDRKKPFTISIPMWLIKRIKADKYHTMRIFEMLKKLYKGKE